MRALIGYKILDYAYNYLFKILMRFKEKLIEKYLYIIHKTKTIFVLGTYIIVNILHKELKNVYFS